MPRTAQTADRQQTRDQSKAVDPREIRNELGLGREPMGRLIGVSQKTIERWERTGAVPVAQQEVLRQLREIARLGALVYTVEGFARFLGTRLSVFGGFTPMDAIRNGRADEVIAVLAADYEGLGQ
jgi:DNA-binding XRE family transcriptional regulator